MADDGTFALAIEGDLRGKALTAYALRYLNLGFSGDYQWTSEFTPVALRVANTEQSLDRAP